MSKHSILTKPMSFMRINLLSLFLMSAAFLSFSNQAFAEAADRDKPIDLEADSVKVDDAKQTSTYSGRVILTQGTLVIHADKLIVREDKEGFQHSTSLGNPTTFRQKREGKDEYMEGSAQRIEYDGRMDKVQLYTKAWVKRGEDIVHGDYIMYDASAEYAEVIGGGSQAATPATPNGRVRAIIQPKNKKGVAPAKPAPGSTPVPEAKPDTSSKIGSPSVNTTAKNDISTKDLRFSRSLQVAPEPKP
jgi:lipopolysaccharide export system protein LptA